MEKEFVPYEEGLVLKELGFDEQCLAHRYSSRDDDFHFLPSPLNNSQLIKENRGCATPTFSQSFRWFRDKYNLHVNKTGNNHYTSFNMTEPKIEVLSFVRYTDTENHYEEAELECLKKLIEIVKNK